MINLTEIVKNSAEYDSEIGTCKSSYSLRDIYINPAYIVTMTENRGYSEAHKRKPLVEDLIPQAKFTRIVLSSGSNQSTSHNVLGSPPSVASLLRERQK